VTSLLRGAGLWRLVILLPLPYIVFVARRGGAAPLLEGGGAPGLDPRIGTALGVMALLAALASVALMWTGDGRLRVAGYLGYALLLVLAFGVGIVAALANAVGGPHGEGPGPLLTTLALGCGAFVSIVALVPLAAAVVADWKGQR